MANTSVVSADLCKICDGRIECAPTAILLISLVQALYGTIGPEPDYFGRNRNVLINQHTKNLRYDKEERKIFDGGNQFGEEEGVHNVDSYSEECAEKNIDADGRAPKSTKYDFIIVGGGTAGCVLASRLSENRKWKILLVEAGPEEPKMALIPGLTSEFRGSAIDWQYSMRPRKGFCQSRGAKGCELVQGRVLGGTSTINDMAYIRGNPVDFDGWALRGNDGWSYNQVLPYFKYSEGNYNKDIAKNKRYHSSEGPLDVGRYPHVDENVDILMSALSELGFNYTDVNGRNQLGFMRIQTMSYFGERVSTYTAFIEPIRRVRSNLDIITEALVTKISFKEKRGVLKATGVYFVKNGTTKILKAKKEVILSAGAINSPKILMQSGIGPREYLEYIGIKVYEDLSVGGNFQDHLSICLPIISLKYTATMSKFTDKLKDISTYYTKGTGPLSANYQVISFYESSLANEAGAPDLEFRFRGHDSNMYYDKIDMCISLISPKSRGQIILNATDPIFGNPLIYPNFLKDPTDLKKLLEGIQVIVKIFDTDVFKRSGFDFDPRAILNNECKNHDKVSEEFWVCIVKHFSEPLQNYAGTCKMGPSTDVNSVVNSHLKLHGIDNLRVVDASIMPKITRGPTAAPVIMIAEKASDLIKTTWYSY